MNIKHKSSDLTFMKFDIGRDRQRGVATLLISVIILLLITITVLYTAKTVFLEQKLTNNDARSKIAFENAESGVAAALNAIRNSEHVVDASDDTKYYVFDSGNDGVADSETTTLDSGSVVVQLTMPDPDDSSVFQIVSRGLSDDGSAVRTITQWVTTIDPLPNEPDNPMITRGGVGIGGAATVYNPEGNSTIWSGDAVTLGNNQKTGVPNPGAADYPNCMATSMACCGGPTATVNDCASALSTTSTRDVMGLDVVEFDSGLANLTGEDFFTNFFGMPSATYRDSVVNLEVAAANAGNNWDAGSPGINLAPSKIIWVDGDASFNGTMGCTSSVTGNNVCPVNNVEPSILIVDGNLNTNGTPHFYGLVYVRGNFNLSGNVTVWGSIVVEGEVPSAGGGSLDVVYRSDVLSALSSAGNPTGTSGSWRDF